MVEADALELLKAVDADGRLVVKLSDYYYHPRAEYSNEMDYYRACIESRLYPLQSFISHRFRTTKIGYNQVQIKVDPEDSNLISFQVAPLLMLPEAGLAELYGLLAKTRPFFEEHAGYAPQVRIFNKQTNRRKTYGELCALYWTSAEPTSSTHEQILRRYVADSPVLTEWLYRVALDLNKLGPNSWVGIQASTVFNKHDDPTNKVLPRRLRGF